MKSAAESYGWRVLEAAVVPDDKSAIQQAVLGEIAKGCRLILTTGGTGVGPRDVTPEAVRGIASRELPGFGETLRRESLKSTPNALLSRSLAAAVGPALVICLPGNPAGAVECLGFVAEAVPHCLDLLEGLPEGHRHSRSRSGEKRTK